MNCWWATHSQDEWPFQLAFWNKSSNSNRISETPSRINHRLNYSDLEKGWIQKQSSYVFLEIGVLSNSSTFMEISHLMNPSCSSFRPLIVCKPAILLDYEKRLYSSHFPRSETVQNSNFKFTLFHLIKKKNSTARVFLRICKFFRVAVLWTTYEPLLYTL